MDKTFENDPFLKYLESGTDNLRLALIDSSYRKKTDQHGLEDNKRLGTVGDAVLRLAITSILYAQETKDISEERKKYESDKTLVTVVAKHYDILKKLNYDTEDENKKGGYAHDNRQKYIATAIEACLGAFYIDNKEDMAEA